MHGKCRVILVHSPKTSQQPDQCMNRLLSGAWHQSNWLSRIKCLLLNYKSLYAGLKLWSTEYGVILPLNIESRRGRCIPFGACVLSKKCSSWLLQVHPIAAPLFFLTPTSRLILARSFCYRFFFFFFSWFARQEQSSLRARSTQRAVDTLRHSWNGPMSATQPTPQTDLSLWSWEGCT